MSNAEDLKQIEVTIEEAQYAVSMSDALDRLSKNRDFKKVIERGYFEQEAIRLVMMKAAPAAQNDIAQGRITKEIDAIGSLRLHFQSISSMGRNAAAAIKENEAMREEILREEGAE